MRGRSNVAKTPEMQGFFVTPKRILSKRGRNAIISLTHREDVVEDE
jgi:hypothetical protein